MPGAGLVLNKCSIYSKYTAVTWTFTDLTSLTINGFTFDSMQSFDTQAGWPLFEIFTKEEYNTQFTLKVVDFKLTGFIFNGANLFEIPLRNANVNIEGLTILDSIFKNAYILKDTYAGTESPLKSIEMNKIFVNNTMFSQKSGIV